MNNDLKQTIKKELGMYGISIIDAHTCSFEYKGKKYKSEIPTKLKLLRKNYFDNQKVFVELVKDVSQLLGTQQPLENNLSVDVRLVKLFINSLKDLYKFLIFVRDNTSVLSSVECADAIRIIRMALNKDYRSFPKEVIYSLPDYKIALDYIYRRNDITIYISRLLKVFINMINPEGIVVKEAKGIQGPWGNLDLPMKEREFLWSDIEEEIRGRDRDIKRQRRYRMGLENYNNDGRVGEGFYWREMRNEPYSWDNRKTDSPYSQLGSGTWR